MEEKTILQKAMGTVDELTDKKYPGNHFFKGSKLASMKTKKGTIPSCLIHTVNRNAGKTTYYAFVSIVLYKYYGYNSMYLVRGVEEIDGYYNVFMDVLEQYFPDIEISERKIISRAVNGIYLNGECAIYVASIKKADTIKKYSPLFRKVLFCLIEEYQPLNGKSFVKNEVAYVNSIIRSITRGGGAQVRNNCQLILLGNPITLMNVYLIEFDLVRRYKKGRKYIFTDSCVAEFNINEESSRQIMESGFSSLFGKEMSRNDAGLDFMIEEKDYVMPIPDETRYFCTLIMNRDLYGVRIYEINKVHISNKCDPSCDNILAFNEYDRIESIAQIIEKKDYTFSIIRDAYKLGNLRFDSLKTKNLIFQILGIDAYTRIC